MLIVWRLELSVLISVIIDRWTLEIWWDIEVDTDDNEEGWSTVEYHNNNHTDKIISNLIVDWMNISTRGAGVTPSSWIPVSRVRIIVTSLVCTLNTDWIKTCNSDKWSWTQEKTVKDSLHCLVLYSCQPLLHALDQVYLFLEYVCYLMEQPVEVGEKYNFIVCQRMLLHQDLICISSSGWIWSVIFIQLLDMTEQSVWKLLCHPHSMIIYRMVIVEGRCDQLTSSSLHTYIIIGWHKV